MVFAPISTNLLRIGFGVLKALWQGSGKAEVTQLYVIVFCDEYVSTLDISMYDVRLMYKTYRAQHIINYFK